MSACCALVLPAATALAQRGGAAKVATQTVELRDLPASKTLVATVEPVTRSAIGAEIAGLVKDMPVREGDFVRGGELLCKLKDDTIRLRLSEAQERLKGLEATLRKWELEQERVQRLYGSEDAAEKEVYDTRAAYDLARHALSEQQAVAERLENDLGKTEIRAPFSGFIIARHAEVGQWLAEGGDVVEIADLSTVLVRTALPEGALPYVRVGDAAAVMIEALGRKFEGRVRHIIPQADPTARTFPVEIAVANPGYAEVGGELVPRMVAQAAGAESEEDPAGSEGDAGKVLLAGGMFARVTVQAGRSGKTPAVPKDAVVNRNGVEYVCLVTPGQQEGSLMAVPTPVTTGLDVDDWIAVTSGNLAAGMRVVTKGNENILFPSPIEIVDWVGGATNTAAASETVPSRPKVGS